MRSGSGQVRIERNAAGRGFAQDGEVTRRALVITAACLALSFSALAATPKESPDQLLRRGQESYRSGHYAEAVQSLQAAVPALLSPATQQRYVETGQLDELAQVETALVYLALAWQKAGREDDARDAIRRLLYAERIAPIYANLPLTAEVADFEPLVSRLVVTSRLGHNSHLPSSGTQPVQSALVLPSTIDMPPPVALPTPSDPAERKLLLQLVDERAADVRSQIEKDAAARIAAAQRDADSRVAAALAAIERDAAARIEAGRAAAATKPPRSAPAADAQNLPRLVDTAKPRPAATSHAAPVAPGAGTSSLRSYDEMARSFAAHPTGAFTVQFELVCEAPSLTIAIKQGGDEVWFVPIVYRARGCYRVFWGHYATRAEAQRGIAAIPASLRGSNPTVVSVPRP